MKSRFIEKVKWCGTFERQIREKVDLILKIAGKTYVDMEFGFKKKKSKVYFPSREQNI